MNKNCPNCGKKGFRIWRNCFIKNKTHKCKYCDMEFRIIKRKGENAWEGHIPTFIIKEGQEKT